MIDLGRWSFKFDFSTILIVYLCVVDKLHGVTDSGDVRKEIIGYVYL